MKKEQAVIAALGSNLSNIAILAGFLVMPAACLNGTAQPGTDIGGATELSDEDVTELSDEAVTALSDDQEALHGADGDRSSAVASPAMEGGGILPMEEIDEIDGLRGEASQEEVMPVMPIPGFLIRSDLNNKCLDILGIDAANGAHVGMWDCWGGANQRWYWDGRQIRSDLNNKCLDILGIDAANGAHVGMWDCWGGANQRWYWDGRQIRSDLNNKCLDILGVNIENGAHVGMWDCWGGANQHWYQE
jgi:hypothetical protein